MGEFVPIRPEKAPPTGGAVTVGRGVLAIILVRELRLLAEDFRCHVSCLLIVSLMGFGALVYAARYRTELREYRAEIGRYSEELRQATVDQAAEVLHPAVKPPWRLAFLVDGGQQSAPNVYRQALSAWVEPELARGYGADERSRGPESLDWMFLLRVVLSLAAFALGYDAVCGARQRATLRMLLSYPVARWQILTAKFVAAWSCLALPFFCGAVVSLLILTGYGGLRFSAGELGRIGGVAVLSLWAMALFLLIAQLVSSLNRDSTRSLAMLALIWVMAVEVVPAASGLLAHGLRPTATDRAIERQMAEIRHRVETERGGPGSWRGRSWAKADDYAWERISAQTQNLRYALQEKLRRAVLEHKLSQLELARNLSLLSPICLIQELAERLVGSGSGRDRSFLEDAWAFGDILAGRVRILDARDPHSPHVLYFTGYMSERPVDGGAFPRFSFRERSPGEGLRASVPHLLLLVLETATVLTGALYYFGRYDLG
ncbi:MAG: ABC transporter permease subunit [bacterium]|nr:ABC transporter permease subunit [bacterium]